MDVDIPGELVHRLIAAVRGGRADEVQLFVQSQPELARARDSAGISALVLALYHGHPEIARWLAARGHDLDIFEAVSLGDLAAVEMLITADPGLVHAWSPDGFQPLGLASFFGHLAVVCHLLERGADVNAVGRNEGKYTALTGAVTAGKADVVEELLRRGAAVNYRYAAGFTPLHVAAAAGRTDIVRLLLRAGATLDAVTDEGRTARDFAVHREQAEVVRTLDDWARGAPGPLKQ